MYVPFKMVADTIGQVADIDGKLFWASEARETKHGFYIWLGWQEQRGRGKAAVILTQELADHLVKHRFSRKWADIPLCGQVLYKLRKRMGYSSARALVCAERKNRAAKPLRFVADIDGVTYRVTREFVSRAGIAIFRGIAEDPGYVGAKQSRPRQPGFILTQELAAFIRAGRADPRGLGQALPLDLHTLSSMRRRLGLNWHNDIEQWWAERFDELMLLTPKAFAAKHGKRDRSVFDMRSAIRHVQRKRAERHKHAAFFHELDADWSNKEENIKVRLGSGYYRLRNYRQAWNVLKAAGRIVPEDQDLGQSGPVPAPRLRQVSNKIIADQSSSAEAPHA